jgi:hypothetical protein
MSIENLKKHQGQLSNTGVRVAVVFRKLPNDENNCLIVETERLPDSYHDSIIQILNSREASETNDLYEVLNRRTFPDGTNCLASLHHRGYLRKEPVSNITMYPLPGQAVPLALINATIDGKLDQYKAQSQSPTNDRQMISEVVVQAQKPNQDPVEVARGLIAQAELLEQDASLRREQAYQMAPDLRPGRGRPSDPEEIRAQKLEERKTKRRERDRKNAAQAKEDRREADINLRVAAKIERDSVIRG